MEHERKRSLERYRPGALSRENSNRHEDESEFGNRPLPEERDQVEGDLRNKLNQNRNNRGRGGSRGGGRGWGRGRGRGGGRNGDLSDLMGEMNIENQDLRYRLNQRTRDPEPANGDNHYDNYDRQDQSRNNDRRQHSRIQGRGSSTGGRNLPRPKRNTENFNPSHEPTDMRVLVAYPGLKKFNKEVTSRDVIIVSDLFGDPEDLSIYNKLMKELENVGMDGDKLWQSWHGDSHQIADDKKRWKQDCPTFGYVIEKIKDYFNMDVKATRLNWYRNSDEWKPFHHDAAAVKPDKARTQNFTVAVSFGMERDAAFEHAKTKTKLSMPQPNGTIYTFGKDVNILWRHGILQTPPEKFSEQGRLSIIAWGWIEQTDV